MAERMPKHMAYDRWLFGAASVLLLGGLLMVGSSSNYVALDANGQPSAYWLRHVLHALLGFVALFAAMRFPYARLEDRRLQLALFATCLLALLIVLFMPAAGGARRWLDLGPLKLQPSEFAKLFAVAFMARFLAHRERQINEPVVLLRAVLVVGALGTLVLLEPDLGSAAMLVLSASVMTFVAGLSWRNLGIGVGVAAALLGVAVLAAPYRLERVASWWSVWSNPAADSLGSNFQLDQSLLAIGSGGVTGVGLGKGKQKAFYVPASHTDFIFSVIGEELGLGGTATVLFGFLVVGWRGLRAAARAPERFGFYLALGLTSLLVFQALTNMAVCLGLLPTKGLPLPFISYGGSSLLASMLGLGVLLNVSQHSN